VPGEISLSFSISGCPLRCPGCHSPFLWKEGNGSILDMNAYEDILRRYSGFASCVLFMGGEWHSEELTSFLRVARHYGYKTCLYTGLEQVDPSILEYLTYLKTGPWIREKGGLGNETTNQVFKEVQSNTILNHLFISK